jgi:hypothetical protein
MNKRIIPPDDPRWAGIRARAELQAWSFAMVRLIGPVVKAMTESSEAFARAGAKLKEQLEWLAAQPE